MSIFNISITDSTYGVPLRRMHAVGTRTFRLSVLCVACCCSSGRVARWSKNEPTKYTFRIRYNSATAAARLTISAHVLWSRAAKISSRRNSSAREKRNTVRKYETGLHIVTYQPIETNSAGLQKAQHFHQSWLNISPGNLLYCYARLLHVLAERTSRFICTLAEGEQPHVVKQILPGERVHLRLGLQVVQGVEQFHRVSVGGQVE